MIPVAEAPPPAKFDERVKNPGLSAIAELVGEKPDKPRKGPRRNKVADRREDIPPDEFPPYWRDVLPEMLESYDRICAYLSLYIPRATGSPSVDHIIPKSKAWDRVYEWSNYRLACARLNSWKSVNSVLDPFAVEDGWFALEFVEFQVMPGPRAAGAVEKQVEDTIEKLGLNDQECCDAREEYVEAYLDREPIPLWYLKRRAPFIARELRRQGMLRAGDV